MKPKRILVPIDIARCPLEVFSRVNAFADPPGVTVILLSVVTLNIAAAGNRVFEELGQEAGGYLERLARNHVHPDAATLIHVRIGKPADEILAEAKAEDVDLIILATFGGSLWKRGPSFWRRLVAPIFPGMVVEELVRKAPCAVLFKHAESRFNCQQMWGRQGCVTNRTLDRLRSASQATRPEIPAGTDAAAPRDREHRAAA
jgi:nucleotide-binding universal stress UspA family protein